MIVSIWVNFTLLVYIYLGVINQQGKLSKHGYVLNSVGSVHLFSYFFPHSQSFLFSWSGIWIWVTRPLRVWSKTAAAERFLAAALSSWAFHLRCFYEEMVQSRADLDQWPGAVRSALSYAFAPKSCSTSWPWGPSFISQGFVRGSLCQALLKALLTQRWREQQEPLPVGVSSHLLPPIRGRTSLLHLFCCPFSVCQAAERTPGGPWPPLSSCWSPPSLNLSTVLLVCPRSR